jgi:hypothetical protein
MKEEATMISACVLCEGSKAAVPGDDLCAECREVLAVAGVVRFGPRKAQPARQAA